MTDKKTGVSLADFDIDSLSENAYEFELKHPVSGVSTGVFMSVIGDNSDAVIAASKKYFAAKAKFDETTQKRGKAVDYEQVFDTFEKRNIEMIASRIVGWRGINDFEYSRENAMDLVKRWGWVQEQVLEESKELGNFIKA